MATLPDAGKHPPGVSVDPAGELPARTQRARTSLGVIVLGAPTDPATLRTAVRAYFRAILEESPGELEALLAPRAAVTTRSRQVPAREYFLSRFARHEYGALRGSVLYRDEDIEITEPEPSERRERAARAGLDPEAAQRVVRIPVSAAAQGQKRVFGDDVVLRLVARGSGWSVLEIVEDF
ncbi:MAG TPA: hypothetical protein VFZ53_03275 [Polyangiaceae bacterium]